MKESGKTETLPGDLFLADQWHFAALTGEPVYDRIPDGCRMFALGPEYGADLDTVAAKPGKRGDECVVYNEFMLAEDRELGFGAGTDCWMEAWLNGSRIFTNRPGEINLQPCASAEDHGFTGPGRKGRNLLAVRLPRGANAWLFYLKGKDRHAADPCYPLTVTADPERIIGRIKPMNAVNNGPIGNPKGRGNLELWQAAEIPAARTHDASFCSSYGGEHTVDVHAVFPDFSKDPDDPASYHFSETDRYLNKILEGGSRVFYRLGSKIEHAPEKYGTTVPADFRKWAVICEHIIRHYNEGWADGFHMQIEYWEIWNEPDHLLEVHGNPTWQGTPEEFYELYRVAATHLKKCFPQLKIGGPALRGRLSDWLLGFLKALTAGGQRAPLDFFSWHAYTPYAAVGRRSAEFRRLLDSFGYEKTESILNEWNYSRGGSTENFNYSVRTVIGTKGAAFTAAAMCSGQNAPLDMMMYYDARPSVYNGLFDFYTFAPLKTYCAVKSWSQLARLGNQIGLDTQEKNGVYACAAADGGKIRMLISRYFETDSLPDELEITVRLKKGDLRGAKVYLLDETHDLEEIPVSADPDGNPRFRMKANTVVFLET